MRWLISLGFILSMAAVSHAQSTWPEFRGNSGSGHADQADLPIAIDESVVRWQIPIHGRGWSSPVAWNDRIWLTTAREDGTQRSVICVNREDGAVVHDNVILAESDPPFCYPANTYATCTPIVTADRVFVHFGSSLTACLDSETAEVLWRREDLRCDHHRGAASSPILFDGKLFIAFDGFDVQYVVALDAKTGETIWKRDREINYGTDNGDQMKAYSTASVIDANGRPLLICPSAVATIAYDPSNGDTVWTVYHGGMNASLRPVMAGNQLIITNGSGSILAVRVDGRGDVTGTHIDWSEKKSVPKKSSPLVVDGLIYLNSDDGVISCREAETGEVLWLKRIGGEYAASPICAGGYVYFFSVGGDIITIRPGRELDIVAETKLGDGFMASPAVVDDDLILRSKSTLYCVAKSALAGSASKR